MHWKLKARIQNLVSLLPSRLGYDAYYLIQRHFGSLRTSNPVSRLQAGVDIIHRIQKEGCSTLGRTFLEVGTGHQLNIPTALWMCGAGRSITIDLNPYLKFELIQEDIAYVRKNWNEIFTLFGDHAQQRVFRERSYRLLGEVTATLDDFLRLTNIKYLAPVDAAHLELESQSVDFHISYTTLEHIPQDILSGVLLESRRVLKRDGLFVHLIDMTDHFSHSDQSISSVHFLQFSDSEWKRYAGNRYMYHNRLRVDEFIQLLNTAGFTVLSVETKTDPMALEALRQGFPVNERFRSKAAEVNATSNAWVVARPSDTIN